MPQTTTVADIIAEARLRADATTPDPTVDFTTDAELEIYVNKAWRQLRDFIILCGDAAIDLMTVDTVLTSPYALPANFYRLVGVDGPNPTQNGQWLPLKQFQFRQRNDYADYERPRYRLVNGVLKFSPEGAAPPRIRLWYVAWEADVNGADTITAFNGWDDYLVGSVAAAICVKEDRDPTPHLQLVGVAAERIKLSCVDLNAGDTQVVAEVEHQWEEIYDLI